MDARDAMQDPAEQDPAEQGPPDETERRQMDQSEPRRGFRPLALPALTAAARARKPETKAASGTVAERQGILAIVHEDAPLV